MLRVGYRLLRASKQLFLKALIERFRFLQTKGAVIIDGGGWHRREKGWVNKI
jgi:hypothetical protein